MEPEKTGPTTVQALTKLAWPLAFVAALAMILAFVRDRSGQSSSSDVRVEHASATVVRELRGLARLETAALRVEKIVEVKDHQKRLSGLVDAEDSLLFVASGEVVLGVDLAKIGERDVRIDPATQVVHLELPEPEVLTSRFDEPRSYVHARTTDLLAKRNEALEGAARREALAAFEKAGRDPGAIESAKAQAEKQLRALGRAWGAKDVVVTWRGARGEVGLGAESDR